MTHFHGLWARLVEVVVLVRELPDHVQLVSFDIALEHFRRGVAGDFHDVEDVHAGQVHERGSGTMGVYGSRIEYKWKGKDLTQDGTVNGADESMMPMKLTLWAMENTFSISISASGAARPISNHPPLPYNVPGLCF